MGFRLLPKSLTLSDYEQPNGRYYTLFHHIMWQLSEATESDSLKLEPYCQQENVSQGSNF